MEEILKTIITSLVEDEEAVEIKKVENQKSIVFEVKVAQKDMGRVIGRQGRLARSIRTVMKSIANKEQKRATVEFIG